MGKSLKNISYDLAQNIIVYEDLDVASLKHVCLMRFIENVCRDEDIIDIFFENIKYIKKSLDPHYIQIISYITNLLTEKIFEFCKLNCDLFNIYFRNIKENVCFVGIQICDMIKYETISIDDKITVFLLLKNLVITSQGTINLKKTVIRMLERNVQPPFDKCEIGCYYFIEKSIINDHSEIIFTESFNTYIQNFCNDSTISRYIEFWKWIFRRYRRYKKYMSDHIVNYRTFIDMEKYSNFDENETVALMNIFEQSVVNNNENAVQYLWVNYISGIPGKEYILWKVLRVTIPVKTNITMYLLLQTKKNKLVALLKANYFLIIQNIAQNLRWHSLFIDTFNELKVYFNSMDYMKLLNILTRTHFINYSTHIDNTIYCINSLPNSIRECLSLEPTYTYENLLIKPFIAGTETLVETLLNFGNKNKFKAFLSTNFGIDILANTIQNSKLEFVEKTLQKHISDNISEVKRYLFYGKIEILFKHFMQTFQFETLCNLLNWLSDALPEEINKFKEEIPYKYNGMCLKQIIFSPNIESQSDPLTKANEFLLWCLRTDKSVNLFKKNISLCPIEMNFGKQNIIYYKELKTWILKSEWNLIEKFINWIDCNLNERKDFIQVLVDDIFPLQIKSVKKRELFLKSFILFLEKILNLDPEDIKFLEEDIKFLEKIKDKIMLKYSETLNDLVS